MDVPVLIIAFNRPDLVNILINELRHIAPKKIYFAVDGPRKGRPEEQSKVLAVQESTSKIDWNCELKTLFREENLGCRNGVSTAISWFFEHEPLGIILEDDCVPAPAFFTYCEQLLERYKDDRRVFSISGYNPVDSKLFESYKYDYWYYPTSIVWGWASWRDRWQYFQQSVDLFYEIESNGQLSLQTNDAWFSTKYSALMRVVLEEKLDTWDYIWSYTHLVQNGYSIVPKVNYLNNIGCDHPDASHKFPKSFRANQISESVKSLQVGTKELLHPPYMIRYRPFEDVLKAEYLPKPKPMSRRIKDKIRSLIPSLK